MSDDFQFDDFNLGGGENSNLVDLFGDDFPRLDYSGVDPNLFSEGLDLQSIFADPEIFNSFAKDNPEAAEVLRGLMGDSGELKVRSFTPAGENPDESKAETERLLRQSNATPEGDETGIKSGTPVGDEKDPTGIKKLNDISGNKPTTQTDKKSTNPLADLLSGKGNLSSLLSTGLSAYMAKKAYDEGEARRKAARGATFKASTPTVSTRQSYGGSRYAKAAQGGLMALAQGGKTNLPPRYLDGHSDGMADKIPAKIDDRRPAALSDGEFVIPADVVSHLGNGNSSAGARRLYEMMDRIRHARTGNHKQGKQINPDKFLLR